MITIAAPMSIELAGIRKRLRGTGQGQVSLQVTGIGRAATTNNWARIVSAKPHAIVLAGFCGAAAPGLRSGDLHIADSFMGEGMADPIRAHEDLTRQLIESANTRGLKVVAGPSATVTAVAGVEAKQRLHQSLGAATVNMEDYWAAQVSRAAGIPVASVRAVVDTAAMELPPFVSAGGSNIAIVAVRVAARPDRFPQLINLARVSRQASKNLSTCVVGAVDGILDAVQLNLVAQS